MIKLISPEPEGLSNLRFERTYIYISGRRAGVDPPREMGNQLSRLISVLAFVEQKNEPAPTIGSLNFPGPVVDETLSYMAGGKHFRGEKGKKYRAV